MGKFQEKKELIKSYDKTRRLNIDIFADTYRGGMDDVLYQPFSFGQIKKEWECLLNGGEKIEIDFYVHIPFCLTICKFCDYYKEIPQSDSIKSYLGYIYSYLDEYKKVFEGHTFRGLYIGGGTPSMLSSSQIDELLGYILSNFKFCNEGEKTFEVNPININEKKVEIIAKHGINRISMGVQSLDPQVLKKANRDYQGETVVKKAIEIVKSYGIYDISLDVVMGLKEDNLINIVHTLKRLYSFRPSNIVLYWLLPTDEYLDEHFKGNLELFYKESFHKIETYHRYLSVKLGEIGKFDEVKIDKDNGYRWDLTLKKFPKKQYDDFSTASLFGVGASSRSHIFGKMYYEMFSESNLNFSNIEKNSFFGSLLEKSDEISLYTVVQIMNYGSIDVNIFQELFHLSFTDYYKEELNFLVKMGKVVDVLDRKINFNFSYREKNYYALFFLDNNRLQSKNVLHNFEQKIYLKFVNGLEISILFIEKDRISYSLVNHHSYTSKNSHFFYTLSMEIGLVFQHLFKKLNGNGLCYLRKTMMGVLLKKYKKSLLHVGQ